MEAAVTTRNCWLGGFLAPGLLRRWKTLSLEVQLAPHHQVKNHSIILPCCRRNHCIGKQKTPEELKNLLGINILIKKMIGDFYLGKCLTPQRFCFQQLHSKEKNWGQGKSPGNPPTKGVSGNWYVKPWLWNSIQLLCNSLLFALLDTLCRPSSVPEALSPMPKGIISHSWLM